MSIDGWEEEIQTHTYTFPLCSLVLITLRMRERRVAAIERNVCRMRPVLREAFFPL